MQIQSIGPFSRGGDFVNNHLDQHNLRLGFVNPEENNCVLTSTEVCAQGNNADISTNVHSAKKVGMARQSVKRAIKFDRVSSPCVNYPSCVCCKYPSPINIHALDSYLALYPDKASAAVLKEGFVFGFKLGYQGDRKFRESPNLKSINTDPDMALAKVMKEVGLSRIAGPFSQVPISDLIISPIGLVPKSEPGKFRLIQHLSFPDGQSINDGIDPDVCVVKYASFDLAIQLVVSNGKGALMAKADIESAFRLLPIHPQDFQLLGMKIGDKYFVDKALPMGASCSPALFEKFSTFIEWVVKKEASTDNVTHYMDDFFLVGLSDENKQNSCAQLVSRFEGVCEKLGVPLAKDKSVGPVSKITYLGLEIDAANQLVAVPHEKLIKIKSKVDALLSASEVTLRELQSVIGSLSFICKAVSPGRAFLRRLIDLTCGISKPWCKLKLSVGAKKDLEMWRLFLNHFNGSAIFPDQAWCHEADLEWFTDASAGIGCGGFFQGRWFQSKWPNAKFKNKSIAWLEFFPIVVSVVLWGDLLIGKRIVIRSDNKAVVYIINKQTSKSPDIMKLVRFFVLQCLKSNLGFCAKHIAGKQNNIADALSRFQEDRFRELAPTAAAVPTQVPQFLWNL